jgi:hypothetical protein
MWAQIRELQRIHKATEALGDRQPIRIDGKLEESLQKRLERLDDLLRRPEHLNNMRTLAGLARPPGVKEQPIEETF